MCHARMNAGPREGRTVEVPQPVKVEVGGVQSGRLGIRADHPGERPDSGQGEGRFIDLASREHGPQVAGQVRPQRYRVPPAVLGVPRLDCHHEAVEVERADRQGPNLRCPQARRRGKAVHQRPRRAGRAEPNRAGRNRRQERPQFIRGQHATAPAVGFGVHRPQPDQHMEWRPAGHHQPPRECLGVSDEVIAAFGCEARPGGQCRHDGVGAQVADPLEPAVGEEAGQPRRDQFDVALGVTLSPHVCREVLKVLLQGALQVLIEPGDEARPLPFGPAHLLGQQGLRRTFIDGQGFAPRPAVRPDILPIPLRGPAFHPSAIRRLHRVRRLEQTRNVSALALSTPATARRLSTPPPLSPLA